MWCCTLARWLCFASGMSFQFIRRSLKPVSCIYSLLYSFCEKRRGSLACRASKARLVEANIGAIDNSLSSKIPQSPQLCGIVHVAQEMHRRVFESSFDPHFPHFCRISKTRRHRFDRPLYPTFSAGIFAKARLDVSVPRVCIRYDTVGLQSIMTMKDKPRSAEKRGPCP